MPSLGGRLIRNMTPTQLVRAVSYREINDETVWVRQGAAAIAARLLGLDPELAHLPRVTAGSNQDGFDDLRVILETVAARSLFVARIADAYDVGDHPAVRRGVHRWLLQEMCRPSLGALREWRAWYRVSQTRRLGRNRAESIRRVFLDATEDYPMPEPTWMASVSDDVKTKRFGVLLFPGGERTFQPVVDALHRRGVQTVWLRVGTQQQIERRPWGWAVRFSPPSAEELSRDAKSRQRFVRAWKFIEGLSPESKRDGLHKDTLLHSLPHHLVEWVGMEWFLDYTSWLGRAEFALVGIEGGAHARTLTVACRRLGVPTFAYLPHLSLSDFPSEWKFLCDVVCVSGMTRVRSAIRSGMPPESVVPVGSTWLDACLPLRTETAVVSAHDLRVLFLSRPSYKSVPNEPLLDAVVRACEASGRAWSLAIKPHPVDGTSYAPYTARYPGRVRLYIREDPIEDALRGANVVVSGVSYAIFETVAAGRPVFVIEWSGTASTRQLARADLQRHVRCFESLAEGEAAMRNAFRDGAGLRLPELPTSVVSDIFWRLDGRTGDRLADVLLRWPEADRKAELSAEAVAVRGGISPL